MSQARHHSVRELVIPARDGYALAASLFEPQAPSGAVVLINSATATPRQFYRHFAAALARAGYTVVTWDYRGIGGSAPDSLRGFEARMRDWVLLDMAGMIDWVADELNPQRLFLVGHSAGGQLAGLLDNSSHIHGMVTLSAQTGHWRYMGGGQKWVVLIHTHISLPALAHLLGYIPYRRLMGGTDLPRGVALEWSRWCRDRDYILGDSSLPLERYQGFRAPVLAYSIEDDNWGTARAVDAMMRAYPNLERRHLEAGQYGLSSIGHFGWFREGSDALWREAIAWFGQQA